MTMQPDIDAASLIGTHDIVLITLDTLRFDVAQAAHLAGETPCLSALMPDAGWEPRHTPGSFTYAAHHAFFAGFLPTPVEPGIHPRLFATSFGGAESVTGTTAVFDAPDIVTGLAGRGYHTICIGGTGFFNPASPVGAVLPGLFAEAHWRAELGVTDRESPKHQVEQAVSSLEQMPADQRAFLFINVSAIHQPNCHYAMGAETDNIDSHRAALRAVDSALPPLFEALHRRGPSLLLIMADHGTAYGEDGYHGHRLAHPVVWTVPYLQAILPAGVAADD